MEVFLIAHRLTCSFAYYYVICPLVLLFMCLRSPRHLRNDSPAPNGLQLPPRGRASPAPSGCGQGERGRVQHHAARKGCKLPTSQFCISRIRSRSDYLSSPTASHCRPLFYSPRKLSRQLQQGIRTTHSRSPRSCCCATRTGEGELVSLRRCCVYNH